MSSNNSDKKKLIKDVLNKVEQIHRDKLNSNPDFKFLIEIIKFFSRLFGKKVRIVVGFSSKEKVVEVLQNKSILNNNSYN